MSEQADAVTAVSPFVQSWVREELGIETRVVPNGIDCDRFRPDRAETDPDTALYIGRFVDRKNPSLLPELARELPDVDFLARGEGDVEIATDPPNLRLLGYLSNDELADLVSRAGALLCPFEREAFGMVLLEAMASGTPIVGLDSGNVPHLLTEDCGVVCESLDTDEWVDGLRTALAGEYDPRPVAEDYSWSNVASQYYEIYEAVRRR